ncbi:MAG: response regulator transcription factor [Nitrospira sp.]
MTKHLLLIKDDEEVSTSLQGVLEAEGYLVDITQDDQAGIQQGLNPYDLIILDLRLPNNNGHEVCRALRREQIQTPILIVTATHSLDEKLSAFAQGADDYLTKPFAVEELLARTKALLRRKHTYKEQPDPVLRVADLTLNYSSREVRRGSTVIALTRKEFDLLAFLMAHPNKALSRTSILEQVWGYHYDTLTNTIDVYIRYLRKKVDEGAPVKLIHTVREFGYKISD